ncbi:MAG: response regulator [Bdellovibrionales bacterium]|nr:response regulator [Bdellovibrionales bacterium]
MPQSLNILLIEDNDDHAQMIARHLGRTDEVKPRLTRRQRLSEGLSHLTQNTVDVLLLDLGLPDSTMDSTLPVALRESPDTPIIVLSSIEDRELAVRMVHQGAQDYLCKSEINTDQLIRSIRYAIERKEIQVKLELQSKRSNAVAEITRMAISERDFGAIASKYISLVTHVLNLNAGEILLLKRQHFIPWTGSASTHADDSPPAAVLGDDSIPSQIVQQHQRSKENRHSQSRVFQLQDTPLEKWPRSSPQLGTSATGIATVIFTEHELNPYGVSFFCSQTARTFSVEEIEFIEVVTNTIATAISQNRLEADLIEKINELDNAHRRKDEFLATLSHELRTPLNVIVGYSDIIGEIEPGTREFRDALDAINKNARIEAQLISETLDISRIITGKFTLHLKPFSLEDLVDSVVVSMSITAHAKGVSLSNARESENNRLYNGDEGRIRQVLWNLLSNAIKFTPKGGQVTVRTTREGSMIQISVEDTGKGIAPESLPYVFEKFWQEESSIKRTYSGMGLGLSIVKHIVELHGGRVSALSPGVSQGAVFTVWLPDAENGNLEQGTSATTLGSSSVRPIAGATVPTKTKRSRLKDRMILVVDDDEPCCQLMQYILEAEGASVVVTQQPFEGFKLAQSQEFDCLVSDIGMPELDGYELIAKVRAWEIENHLPPLPAIALTAYGGKDHIDRARRAGFNDHHEKPLMRDKFVETVCALLSTTHST